MDENITTPIPKATAPWLVGLTLTGHHESRRISGSDDTIKDLRTDAANEFKICGRNHKFSV